MDIVEQRAKNGLQPAHPSNYFCLMRNPLAYFVSVALAFLLLGGAAGGVGYFTLPIVGFVFFPFVDQWAGHSHWSPDATGEKASPAKERAFEGALLSAFVATFAVLGWGLWMASAGSLSLWELIGLTLSVGMFTSYVGIVVGHEYMHRPARIHRAMSWMLMSTALYSHFCVEHISRHHPLFATPEDHATARRGESFYAFALRSIFRGWLSAVRSKPGRVLGTNAALAVILAAVHRWLGADALFLAVMQALVAIVLLEGINYMQHYGLLRARRPNGQYEPPGPGHSWDTSSFLTNTNIFNLGRHTDHHSYARRPYHRLRHVDAAPQLPFGYAAMFLIALVPPLWFRIMDRRLDEWDAKGQWMPEAPAATCGLPQQA